MTRTNRKSLVAEVPDEIWDRAVRDLRQDSGVALVGDLPSAGTIPRNAFGAARCTLEQIHHNHQEFELAVQAIGEEADSAHVTGYHPAASSNSLSRYNLYREGFVWSDGNRNIVRKDSCTGEEQSLNFEETTSHLENLLHDVAEAVLGGLERHLALPDGWFQESLGPTRTSSQWHLKQYVVAPSDDDSDDSQLLLPAHTDPSLISVVIHDRPGQQPGAQGLEYSHKKSCNNGEQQQQQQQREWKELAYSGHSVAVVFVGSVLRYITGGRFPACKHRVVDRSHDDDKNNKRMAATLFLRPTRAAVLRVPPSPLLSSISLKRPVTFEAWNARVARNYEKAKIRRHQPANHNPGTTATKTKSNLCRTVFRDEFTELSLIDCDPPLSGTEKYLGGELGANGKIYTIPGHAARVLCIDPTTPPTVRPIGPTFPGHFKWLRAVRMPQTGIIIGIPCHADAVLRIDPQTDSVSTLDWDTSDPLAPAPGTPWKWHGGQISPVDGCLYCIPQRADSGPQI